MNTSSGSTGDVIAYPIKDALYLNITNRCTNACQFCIRETANGVGINLWLTKEPTLAEILEAVGNPASYKEVVFCGYGEPLLRPEIVIAVAEILKKQGARVRLNTNGLADLFLGYDVLPSLRGKIDAISISLNAADATSYQKVSQSSFGERAFQAVVEFAERSKSYIPEVILSVVSFPGVDIDKAAMLAAEIGVKFRIRDYQS